MISDLRERKSKALEFFLERLLQSEVKNSIGKILLFGSFSRGQLKEGSDIDLLIFVPNQLDEVGDACDTTSFETVVQFGESVEPLIFCLDELRYPHSYFLFKAVKEGKELYAMNERKMRKEEAVGYLDLAKEYMDLAKYNLSGGYYRGVIDAAYNSIELCAKGFLLLRLDSIPTSHGGVVQKFGELYVKTKIISDEVGRGLRHSLRVRNSARYEPHARIAKEDAEKIMDLANSLLKLLGQEV